MKFRALARLAFLFPAFMLICTAANVISFLFAMNQLIISIEEIEIGGSARSLDLIVPPQRLLLQQKSLQDSICVANQFFHFTQKKKIRRSSDHKS